MAKQTITLRSTLEIQITWKAKELESNNNSTQVSTIQTKSLKFKKGKPIFTKQAPAFYLPEPQETTLNIFVDGQCVYSKPTRVSGSKILLKRFQLTKTLLKFGIVIDGKDIERDQHIPLAPEKHKTILAGNALNTPLHIRQTA